MSEYNAIANEHAVKRAKQQDCTIEYAHDLVLQLDLDGDDAFRTFQKQFALLHQLGMFPDVVEAYTVRWSRNGNRHVTINLLEELGVVKRLLLQALLGSDIKREMLGYARVLQGDEHPICLFRPNKSIAERHKAHYGSVGQDVFEI